MAIRDRFKLIQVMIKQIQKHLDEGHSLLYDELEELDDISERISELHQRVSPTDTKKGAAINSRLLRMLLMDTNLTITAIARRVGYTHSSTVSTLTKRKFGMTPTEFRQMYQPQTLPTLKPYVREYVFHCPIGDRAGTPTDPEGKILRPVTFKHPGDRHSAMRLRRVELTDPITGVVEYQIDNQNPQWSIVDSTRGWLVKGCTMHAVIDSTPYLFNVHYAKESFCFYIYPGNEDAPNIDHLTATLHLDVEFNVTHPT